MVSKKSVSHPGIYLLDAIEALGMTQYEFGKRTDIHPKTITQLINGEANITFEIANNLSLFFGNSVELWMNLQTRYNSYLKEKELEENQEKEWEIVKLFDKEFLSQICKIEFDKWSNSQIIEEMKRCFMVTSLQNLKTPDLFSFCKTSIVKDTTEKQIILRNAWISYAMYLSKNIVCEEYDKLKLLNVIPKLRGLTLETPDVFEPKLIEYLSQVGIKFVTLPYLKGSNISGVTRWLPSEKAILVAVNDCGKNADRIWFSIFHELGHAFQNHKRHLTISLEKNNIIDETEIVANQFAENNLIPLEQYKLFLSKKDFTINSIKKFAENIGIADYIVIGRLKKDKLIDWSLYNDYHIKYFIN